MITDEQWEEADQLTHELEWYGLRKKNLADSAPSEGKDWAMHLLSEVRELRSLLRKMRAAVNESGGPDAG